MSMVLMWRVLLVVMELSLLLSATNTVICLCQSLLEAQSFLGASIIAVVLSKNEIGWGPQSLPNTGTAVV